MLGFTEKSFAVQIDSVYADSIYAANGIIDTAFCLHKPDGNFSKFDNGAELDLMFRRMGGEKVHIIKKQSVLYIWGKKDLTVDSSSGQVILVQTDQDGVPVYQSAAYILGDGLNIITVPDSEFAYLQFGLPGGFDPKGSKSYFLDAVMIKQDTSYPQTSVRSSFEAPRSAIIANYPNPFIAGQASTTNLVIRLENDANVEVIVSDALGREVRHLSAGMLPFGESTIPLSVEASGYYFARLVVNGVIQPRMYKLTAR